MIDLTLLQKTNSNLEIEVSRQTFLKIIDYELISTENPFIDDEVKSVIEYSFLTLTDNYIPNSDLAFGDTVWNIKLSSNLAKTSIVASVMIGLLYASGAVDVSSTLITK